MPPTTPCPKCGAAVAVTVGAPVSQCNGCGHLFSPAPPQSIDPFDDYTGKAVSQKAAEDLLGAWQIEMPPVKPAFAPGGALPPAAISMLAAGGLASVAAAVGAELLAGVVAALVLAVLLFCNGIIAVVGFIFWPLFLLLLVFVAVTVAAPFGVGGWAASFVTRYFSSLGKNRNVTAAMATAASAAAVSVLITMAILYFAGKPWLLSHETWELSPGAIDIAMGVVLVVGILTAIGVAAYDVWSEMGKQRFCEDCENHMVKQVVAKLKPPVLKQVVHAIRAKDLPTTISLLTGAKGRRAEVLLHQCPDCRKGCLEVLVHFKVRWVIRARSRKDNGERSLEETWLAVSVSLDANSADAVGQLATT